MKKLLSLILAAIFTLTAFGATTLFAGVFTAGAEFLDYFIYEPIPGFGAYGEQALKDSDQYAMQFETFTDECVPSGEYEGKIAKFTVTETDEWGGAGVRTFNRDWVPEVDTEGANWAAIGYIDGTDIFGDSGITFEDATGFTFWTGVGGQSYIGEVKVTMMQAPCKGPYYDAGDLIDRPRGCVYECPTKYTDADGYIYFDFKTDFKQVDWWSVDDEGIGHYNEVAPIPKSKLPLINSLQIRYANHMQVGESVYIGDFRVCTDTRIHTDELDEQLTAFDSLDPEAYTEESFLAASEAYFKAYDVYLEHENQKEVDAAASELKKAIRDLKPLFHSVATDIQLESFEAWSEEELGSMVGGPDTAMIDKEITPSNKESSVLVMANATEGDPYYGWSCFNSAITEDDTVTPIGNPFALMEGSAPLSESNGLRFWFRRDPSIIGSASAIRIGVGSSASGVYFECDEYAATLPEEEGYVAISWNSLFDLDGEADIYEYIDELDYISIFIYDAVGIYYIADLHAFNWNTSAANFDELEKAIAETYLYLDTLNEEEWYPVAWDRVEAALAAGEKLFDKYGATQDEVDEATDSIQSNVNKLILIGDLATRPTLNKLQALYDAGSSYWRGNVTAASYRNLSEAVETAGQLIEDGPTEEAAQKSIAALDAAIDALVPIKAGEKVTSIYSFESYTNRDLNKANGHRTEGVVYSLAAAEDVPNIPEGYAKALKMVATEDMSSSNTDQHGAMQFKAMSIDTGTPVPIKMGKNGENTLIGDLTGTDGICLWVGVNDVNLVQECTFRFAVSNCSKDPLFERAAVNIPLPSTGSGWIYIPWEYFEFYDAWTNGEEIRLNEIYFYIIRFNGIINQGLEVYSTGIHAYKNTTESAWTAPVIENITDGQTIDVSESNFIPKWNEGTATLNGLSFIYGSEIMYNGEYTLEVRNGNKTTTVNFTVTGAETYTVPVISGVEDGGVYTDPVTLTWDVGTATLNDEVVENGAVISEVGVYTLVVTNGDKEATVKFEISDKPDVMKGDPDGDGMITVADALYTLRIAAQLTEGTADDLLVVDTDGDGMITVADALAILRVAAQLADSL